MGLLDDIQSDALSNTVPVTSLLRKVLVLASKLDSNVLEDWVRHELNGYPAAAELPEYRIIELHFKGHFAGPFGARIENAPIAPHLIEKVTTWEDFNKFEARQPITTIDDSQAVREAGVLKVNFDNLALVLGGKIFQGYHCVQVWGEVPSMGVIGIVEAVKTRVLDFALALGKKYPIAGEIGGMNVKDETTKKDFQSIVQNTIYGNVGVAGHASHSTVNITVNQGNLRDLRQQLTAHYVESADIDELETALMEEPQVGADKKFGPKVGSWIGKMVGKAASGTWGVGLEIGSAVLQKALLAYYGLDN
jgi:hypothetical protein